MFFRTTEYRILSKLSGLKKIVCNRKIYFCFSIFIFVCMAYFLQQNLKVLILQIQELKGFAPILFLVLYCLVSIFCIPALILGLACGALFGPVFGVLWSLLGTTLGAICGFCISRYFLPTGYEFIKNGRIKKLVLLAEKHGWKSVAVLRLSPFMPFNLVNYSLGLTKIKFSHYLFGTVIFIIPNKVIVAFCGYYGFSLFGM